MKKEIRILGFDDMPFLFTDKQVDIVGVIMRGGTYLEGVVKTTIAVDGTDATQKIIELITTSKHKAQLRVIMFDGAALGGFNVIDCKQLYDETTIPTLTITRENPDMKTIKKTLQSHFTDWETRWSLLTQGSLHELKLDFPVYVRTFGLTKQETEETIRISTIRGAIPEPLRVAHLIATGIKKGESRGRC